VSTEGSSQWSRLVARYAADRSDLDAISLRQESASRGCTAVADCPPGSLVSITGTVRSVLLRPASESPAFEAEVFDGSGSVTLIWIGRRRIPGIKAGRKITAFGRIGHDAGRRQVFNPRYSLLVDAGAE